MSNVRNLYLLCGRATVMWSSYEHCPLPLLLMIVHCITRNITHACRWILRKYIHSIYTVHTFSPKLTFICTSVRNRNIKESLWQVFLSLFKYIYNIRTLSVNIKFICTSFRNRQNSKPLASFSGLFRSEYKWILYLTTMYVFCVYPAMSKKSENLSDLNK
jgi:hypothetical protein